jgi:hypothetical protein
MKWGNYRQCIILGHENKGRFLKIVIVDKGGDGRKKGQKSSKGVGSVCVVEREAVSNTNVTSRINESPTDLGVGDKQRIRHIGAITDVTRGDLGVSIWRVWTRLGPGINVTLGSKEVS